MTGFIHKLNAFFTVSETRFTMNMNPDSANQKNPLHCNHQLVSKNNPVCLVPNSNAAADAILSGH